MYKKLLACFDGSEQSRAALREAALWVKKHGGELTMLHSVFFDTEEFGIMPTHLEKRVRHGQEICARAAEEVTAATGVKVATLIREGEPADVISDVAAEIKPDLIVIGTHGRKGLKRLLLGSVTAHVVTSSVCDVLVVKKPCEDCSGTYISSLVSYDGSPYSAAALNLALELSAVDGGEVTALYVIPRYEEMIDFIKTKSVRQALDKEAQRLLTMASEAASAKGKTIKTVTGEGNAADVITDTVKKIGADLIVMGSHGYSGMNRALLGSTAQHVIINAPCPVLVARRIL